ncbi:hypothetical protein GCM10022224_045350 [Nonomuraea antimicrobica]|uniref:Uncharacterized protein n=1 Tax=Nonomuraea antimicrobica TaxID=561173 RepID=A0ABP7C451_9ACTN
MSAKESSTGTSFSVGGVEILRLSGVDRAMLRLTEPVIERLEPHLRPYAQVSVCPDRVWLLLRLDSESDLQLLFALTSVAIKVHLER